jgi:NAD(P)-dependent dehydrogenase (short-subunit alcohol dehydrogenase family)
MSSSLKNKIIVVTGGAGTIGKSFLRGIADSGGIAIVADVNIEEAKKLTQVYAGNAEAVHLNIVDKQSILNLISYLIKKYGHIDALVNNAYPRNINYGKKLEEVNYIDFCENVNMHLGGYFLAAQQFCLAFRGQGYGNIVNMSSIYGSLPPRFEIYKDTSMTTPVEYAAIKAAVENLTRYFAQYYKGTGIRINSLSPGGVLANQPKNFLDAYNRKCSSKGMLNASDLTGALIFLLSDDSKYMTGQNLVIDDGFSL